MDFFAEFGITCTFLLDRFAAYKTRLVLTIISGSSKVNSSVNACDIADIGNIPFLDIISNGDM